MTQIMLPAVFSRKDFDNILRSMSDEDAAAFAATNRTTFASCFSLSAPGSGTADARPANPGPAKVREPKASSGVPIDKTALLSAVALAMTRFPNLRAEDYVAKLEPSDYGATAETIGPAVKKACEAMVSSKAAYCEGNGRGRRYKVAAKAEPEVAAE